ncbi:cation:proton antiporter [Ferruginibacter sp. HRS2-29]|uniref:cation:proton antiporter domain-containing protein n=1 Tax=Ferruginibacter sp. HRS2-29 TaxID=2487334 RepID=UPI0020CD6499|nr:cation:proton antiporter [Ferruginibacter sp. HRS2-29]MCP9753001.1 sodium:proton antiporter [Ferruginibacter sp. HRS2-29]
MTHLPNLIYDLALILGAAGFVTILFKKLKLPLVLGYIMAGFFVGPYFDFLPTVMEKENIQIWAEIGVIFLLFSLGLEFSFKKLIKVGGSASVTGLIEVSFMLLAGYGTGRLLGWSNIDSLFLGGILSISSTTIIMRTFEELNVKTQLFANLVFGVLIVEDLVAILLMVLLSTMAVSQQFAGGDMLFSVLKLLFFLIVWFVFGIFFVPTLLRKAKDLMNDETLLVVSLSLCLLMVVFAVKVGFSPALGAFIMGSILAETTKAEKIEHLTKPVKDLFGAIFFVSVGMMIDPGMIAQYAGPIVLFCVIVITGKFIGATSGALLSGQSLQTSVQTGMSLTQIGEFSFIIATLGVSLKVTSPFLYPIAVAVSAVTTFTTPFLVKYSTPFSKWIEKKLPAPWVASLANYHNSGNNNSAADSSDWQKVLRTKIINIVILSIILLSIATLSSRYAWPYISTHVSDALWLKITTAAITLVLMSPFLWAMALRTHYSKAFNEVVKIKKYSRILYFIRFLRLCLAAAFIGFLMFRFFSVYAGVIVAIVLLMLLFVFAQRIQAFYDRLEHRFLSNYNQREIADAKKNRAELAPWDAHIVRLTIHPQSAISGKSLGELQWRDNPGVNIVAIRRGDINIQLPTRDERIFPSDELHVLGSDAQIKRLLAIIRPPKKKVELPAKAAGEIVLKRIVLDESSRFTGKMIRESGIRENNHGLIVGIERGGKRILNPDSTFVFDVDDVVFIVGEEKEMKTL